MSRAPQLLASQWMHAGPFVFADGRTLSPWSLRERVEELGRTGFSGIGLHQDELAHVLAVEARGSSASRKLAWIRRLLEDNGIGVVELEFLTGWLYPRGHERRERERLDRALLMEAAAALGARHVKIGNIDGATAPLEDLRARFAEICEEARQAGCRVGLELLPLDPNGRTLAEALAWAGGHADGGLYLDSWHVNNMPAVTYDDIAALPPGAIVGVELDDGLVFDDEDRASFAKLGAAGFFAMTTQRRIPGEGEYDLAGFVRAVLATGYDGPWGCEVLSEDYKRLPRDVAYRRVHRAMSRSLGGGGRV